jgi:hypothetical protein
VVLLTLTHLLFLVEYKRNNCSLEEPMLVEIIGYTFRKLRFIVSFLLPAVLVHCLKKNFFDCDGILAVVLRLIDSHP